MSQRFQFTRQTPSVPISTGATAAGSMNYAAITARDVSSTSKLASYRFYKIEVAWGAVAVSATVRLYSSSTSGGTLFEEFTFTPTKANFPNGWKTSLELQNESDVAVTVIPNADTVTVLETLK